MDRLKVIFLDKLTIQFTAIDWYRYKVTSKFFIRGPIRVLQIGSGGGVETLSLLHRGGIVTSVEISLEGAERTHARVLRNGYTERFTQITGHFLKVPIQGLYDQVVICEVLEHILDDVAVLKRLSEIVKPGGRLVLSTPTALYGQTTNSVSLTEDGGHVRVGYEGPELDIMLTKCGFVTIKRFYMIYKYSKWQHRIGSFLEIHRFLKPIRYFYEFASRFILPILELFPKEPLTQLTIAIKAK